MARKKAASHARAKLHVSRGKYSSAKGDPLALQLWSIPIKEQSSNFIALPWITTGTFGPARSTITKKSVRVATIMFLFK